MLTCSSGKANTLPGKAPVRQFAPRFSTLKEVKLLKLQGIPPVRVLLLKLRYESCCNEAQSAGIVPDNLLSWNDNHSMCCAPLRDAGSDPSRTLLRRFRYLRSPDSALKGSLGREPFRPLSDRDIEVTAPVPEQRSGTSTSSQHVMPNHLQ
jgi:hypothetical protein